MDKKVITDIIASILVGIFIVALIRGCNESDKKFLIDVGLKQACDVKCYPKKAVWNREDRQCSCEERK